VSGNNNIAEQGQEQEFSRTRASPKNKDKVSDFSEEEEEAEDEAPTGYYQMEANESAFL